MRILAAFIFFTRLPFWRIKEVPSECFKYVVPYWSLVGWLTGGITICTLWLCAQVMPLSMAWILAIVMRLLITGCLHEDGLADFLDGFGGGTTRERILTIMKDSHIGTYGVIGLILYFALLLQISSLPLNTLCAIVFCADCWSKFCASNLINYLPYARSESASKAQVVYTPMTWSELLTSFGCGVLPVILLLPLSVWPVTLMPLIILFVLILLMKKRLQGYTGDCCGATFLLCELSFLLTSFVILHT